MCYYNSDKSSLFVRKMSDCIRNGNTEQYVKLYEKYMNDDTLTAHMEFPDHPPSSGWNVHFYPYCTCGTNDENEDLIMVMGGLDALYIKICNCKNGKRYCQLQLAYKLELHRLNQHVYPGYSYLKKRCESLPEFEKSDIIQFIEAHGIIDYGYYQWEHSSGDKI